MSEPADDEIGKTINIVYHLEKLHIATTLCLALHLANEFGFDGFDDSFGNFLLTLRADNCLLLLCLEEISQSMLHC